MTAAAITVESDRVHAGESLIISFQRTLRVPDDGRSYPLPPGLGRFPVRRGADYAERLPIAWHNDLLVPMYRREALWIAFEGVGWKPNAVKVGVGGIDAISGAAWDGELHDNPQNYVVAPDQPWIDGINSGAETVRQFVAMPMGEGYSVEAQVTGKERTGGIQIIVFDPLPGKIPDMAPPLASHAELAHTPNAPATLGIAIGGSVRQKIYPDKYGIDAWDRAHPLSIFVRLVNAAEFAAVTGAPQPSTPIDAAAYTAAGLPWFELYDADEGDIGAAQTLARIRSIRELERHAPEPSIEVAKSQISTIKRTK